MKNEPWLTRPHKTKEVLQKYGFRFQKKFGQNFLLDPHVLDRIVAAADLSGDDLAIEIGPGIGTLTQYLCYHAGRVAAIEIDRNLFPILEETLSDWDNVEVIEGDVMKLDLESLIREKRGELTGVKIVANLPYYITTPILMKILEDNLPVDSVTVMVQEEVAGRMQALPGTPDFGALSLAVQYYAVPKIAAHVPPNCFVPRPNVGSSVITLSILPEDQRIPVRDADHMFRVIRASFGQRRKTLVNALRGAPGLSKKDGSAYAREEIEAALEELSLPSSIRGEKLSLEQFARLSDRLLDL
ncbi:MAG: 16S rRNA (adenine(1518)-N(6)/adenine(1519)-N(6))-dimethyltransferase RsmA [Lachnospiraceae bacterium]|nr:16S rRNA (adenine(1518)-N(6)/adenine(1519)-N(6))-dimethyltransferase RsmA [Lachnospiraceae bacterium]MCI1327813.1 16S rRNA (adenine(1518)-N(6)/adenine(1519)-N(6))-dimethyltransferase RsmA [Lachnospiraceae bacterium]